MYYQLWIRKRSNLLLYSKNLRPLHVKHNGTRSITLLTSTLMPLLCTVSKKHKIYSHKKKKKLRETSLQCSNFCGKMVRGVRVNFLNFHTVLWLHCESILRLTLETFWQHCSFQIWLTSSSYYILACWLHCFDGKSTYFPKCVKIDQKR